jgi:hypothetical protein
VELVCANTKDINIIVGNVVLDYVNIKNGKVNAKNAGLGFANMKNENIIVENVELDFVNMEIRNTAAAFVGLVIAFTIN